MNVPKRILVSLVAIAFLAAGAPAQSTAKVAPRTFQVKPVMALIPGTQVHSVQGDVDFDLYQYGGSWFLVENGRWYRAVSWRGPYKAIRMSRVPRPVRNVPVEYRKVWSRPGRSAVTAAPPPSTGVMLEQEPHMASVGTDSRVLYALNETEYDLYALGDFWYMVKDGRWLRANAWRGAYRPIAPDSLPQEIRSIPAGYRKYWVSPATPVPPSRERN